MKLFILLIVISIVFSILGATVPTSLKYPLGYIGGTIVTILLFKNYGGK